MTRTVILMRHAKSNWSNPFQTDLERTLNERGDANAIDMAIRLANRNIEINAIVSSHAVRAKQTAQHVSHIIKQENLIIENALYHAPEDIIDSVIYGLPNKYESVIIVCHNPGITHWVNKHTLLGIDNMPTGAMCALQFNGNAWHNFSMAQKEVLFYDFPKSRQAFNNI